MSSFKLRFAEDNIAKWFAAYQPIALNQEIEGRIVPLSQKQGFITKKDFLTICRWKTNRTQSRCARNSPELIKEVSQIALSTTNEQLRIEIWTLLHGVNWPTASALLHWLHPEEYPILDIRALWSLGYQKRPKFDFTMWQEYFCYCRALAKRSGVSVRMLDRALWQYSAEKQGRL